MTVWWPSTTPMPVTIPAHGASSSYMPLAARALNSRKGVSGSRTASTRSRTNILPRSLCRFTAASPPPFFTVSSLERSSATSSFIQSLLANVVSNVGHDIFRRGTGEKNFGDSDLFQLLDIVVRNNPADENKDVVETLFLHQLHDSRAERHVGSGKHGQ